MIAPGRHALGILLLAAVHLDTGCGRRECDVGEERCDGSTRQICSGGCHTPDCIFGGDSSWQSEPCPSACVDARSEWPGANLFCAVTDVPDPRCGRHTTDFWSDRGYCDGAVAVDCWLGFARSRQDCSHAGKVCVAKGISDPICALSSARDPRCESAAALVGSGEVCDGVQLLTCNQGYVTIQRTCERACVSPQPGATFCAASVEPDPRCAQSAASSTALTCPGDAPALCRDGYVECLAPRDAEDDSAGLDAGDGAS